VRVGRGGQPEPAGTCEKQSVTAVFRLVPLQGEVSESVP